jgi:hypothetical protein
MTNAFDAFNTFALDTFEADETGEHFVRITQSGETIQTLGPFESDEVAQSKGISEISRLAETMILQSLGL